MLEADVLYPQLATKVIPLAHQRAASEEATVHIACRLQNQEVTAGSVEPPPGQ